MRATVSGRPQRGRPSGGGPCRCILPDPLCGRHTESLPMPYCDLPGTSAASTHGSRGPGIWDMQSRRLGGGRASVPFLSFSHAGKCPQAFIALVALAGLLFGDPGVVKRSPATCYPIPGEVGSRGSAIPLARLSPAVAAFLGSAHRSMPRASTYPFACFWTASQVLTRLLNGESLEGLSNVRLDDRTYCIRCLVWRPEAHESRFSGASTCQHCQVC